MKFILIAIGAVLLGTRVLASAHSIVIRSPTHEQTFAYGSEHSQQWVVSGPDRHLALSTEFTNDPYVDRVDVRQYDDFVFHFPSVRLGGDGRTFYYQPARGPAIAVALRRKGFLGIDEIKLLDNAELLLRSPHGYLSLALIVQDRPVASTASL